MDSRLFHDINKLADQTRWAHGLVANFARYGIAVFAVLLLACFLDGRGNRDLPMVSAAVWAGAAALVALAVGQAIGRAVDRARPYDALTGVHVLLARSTDFSFPSDHATVAGAVAAGLLVARWRWGILAAVAAIGMAFARVYAGVHYPSDVIAGLALGAVVATAGSYIVTPVLTGIAGRLAETPLRPLFMTNRAPTRADEAVR